MHLSKYFYLEKDMLNNLDALSLNLIYNLILNDIDN